MERRYGPASLRLSGAPGAAARLMARLRPGPRGRYLIAMADMIPQAVTARMGAVATTVPRSGRQVRISVAIALLASIISALPAGREKPLIELRYE